MVAKILAYGWIGLFFLILAILVILGVYGSVLRNTRMLRALSRAKSRGEVTQALLSTGIEQDED